MKDYIDKAFEHKGALLFVGGIAAGLIGKKVFESEKTRKICANGMAKVLIAKDNAEEAFKEMKDEAESVNNKE